MGIIPRGALKKDPCLVGCVPSDPGPLRPWYIQGTDESFPRVDSLFP